MPIKHGDNSMIKKLIILFLLIPSVCYGGVKLDGSDDRLSSSTIIGDNFSYPFSVMFWFNPGERTGVAGGLIWQGDSTSNVDYWQIAVTAGDVLQIGMRRFTNVSKDGTTVIAGVDKYRCVVGVFAGNSDRKLYLDGELEISDTTASSYPLGSNITCIGSWCRSIAGVESDYRFSEIAFWDAELTQEDAQRVCSGVKYAPLQSRFQPKHYWTLDQCGTSDASCDGVEFKSFGGTDNTSLTGDDGAGNTGLIGSSSQTYP